MKINRFGMLIFSIFYILYFQGCSHKNNENSISVTPSAVKDNPISNATLLPEIKKIKVQPDKTFLAEVEENPYSALSIMTIQAYPDIDKDLFNYLYSSVKNQFKKADISNFKLSPRQIMDTCESLYDRAGFELFYLNRVKWSNDYKSVNFTYFDYSDEEIRENREIFNSKLNHLLNNVSPPSYSPLQKFFSIYEYITKNSSYTYDISDETTHTPYSILVNREGICNGYSKLAHYVLNHVDIPTLYISNASHAWNMVTLLNSKFITDFTWGSGYDDTSYLNTALMDDEIRNQGLINAGFGGEDIIVGYPRENPQKPDSCIDTRFEIFRNIYDNYDLDIENNWIYYTLDSILYRVQLDGSKQEELMSGVNNFCVYEGTIYFRNEIDGGLYSLIPNQTPIPIDTSVDVGIIKETEGILSYKIVDAISEGKEINLNQFKLESPEISSINHLTSFQLKAQESYQVTLTFTTPMDITTLPKSNIGMIANNSKIIPLHMYWDEAGYQLTIRPAAYINKDQGVTFYVYKGIKDINGNLTPDSYDLVITPKP